MTEPLLRTKILIPPLRQNQIERPQLINKINRSKEQALTLIEAPAGFGKTSLAAAWAAQSSFPVAWLTLHQNDAPQERFLSYIVHALQNIFPKIGETTLTLIHSKPIDNAIYALLNDLAEIKQQYALILDDYHNTDTSENADIIQFILENRPPNFHLVITTRNTPTFSLLKLRAKAQINEININEIRFSPTEVKKFLNQCMDISISDLDVTKLANTTEGWPVGLQLAALAYTRNTRDWILPVSQSQIFDYLADEVLSRESKEVKEFLIVTSLFDRFCIPLILSILQETDIQNIDLLLTHIDQSNLFLLHLDHDHIWFRYHSLFAEFLRKQIPDDQAIPYYKKASIWFKEHEMLDDSIHYAIHAGDIEIAAKMLDENYRELLSRGDHASMFEWIEAMPEEVLQQYPKLWLTNGWANMISLEPMEAILCAKKAMEVSKGNTQAHLIYIEAQTIINMANIFIGNIKGLSIESKDIVSFSEQDDFLHTMLHFNHGLYHVLNGNTSQALDAFSQTLEVDIVKNISLLYILTLCQSGETRAIRGAIGLAERLFEQAIDYAKQKYGDNSVLLSLPYISYGEILREQNQFSKAKEYLQNGIQLSYLWEPIFSMDGQISIARLLAAQGYWEKAYQRLDHTLELIKNDGTILNDLFVALHKAKLYLLQGEITSAKRTINFYALDQVEPDPYYMYELSELLLIRYDIQIDLLNNTKSDDELVRLDTLLVEVQERERVSSEIEILILKTYIHHQSCNHNQAIICLSHALTVGAQSGYMRIFADEGATLHHILIQYHDKLSVPGTFLDTLQAIMLSESNKPLAGKYSPQTEESLIPLTRRELDILNRLAAGESNQDIAEHLILSIHTVKKHVANILSKLNVSNRTQAVMLARRMSWIP
jgi:LuxR family maltose regulon positive regulatory protein